MQAGERSIMGLLPAASTTLYNCEWRCAPGQTGPHESKWHLKAPAYPQGGKAERDGDAPARWKNTDHLVPWLTPHASDGINSRHRDYEYHIARHSAASSYSYPTYATEGHHLISCDLFQDSNYPELVHNALLMGYDINCKENGFHVPAFVVDIVCHDLQHHASSHTWSEPAPLMYDLDEKSAPLLAQLQERCYPYCGADPQGTVEFQKQIIADLKSLSDIVRRRIRSWSWFLTKLAKMTLADVRSYGAPVARPPGTLKTKVKADQFDILKEYKEAAFTRENLMPSGFPYWDHYIAAALQELDEGLNPNQPFSRWLTRRMYREKLGRAAAPTGAPA